MSHHPVSPYEHLPAVCRPHDPRAPEVALRVSGMIRERMPGIPVGHVGSTAVPGCAGKGVVDPMIPCRGGELSPEEGARRPLLRARVHQ